MFFERRTPVKTFDELKRDVPITSVLAVLGIDTVQTGQQLRGLCPVCQPRGGDPGLVVTPEKGLFDCKVVKGGKAGGSILDLVMHAKGVSLAKAGQFLNETFTKPADTTKGGDMKPYRATPMHTAPAAAEKKKGFDPDEYAKGLLTEHELLTASGLTSEFCKQHKMGVATKGTNKGLIAHPVRDERGQILFFAGSTDFKVPKTRGSS